jgi:WS/DGAT/MGAT family acyltransferase
MLTQLTEQDASFLYLETAETPQHVASVLLVELPQGYSGDFYQDYKKHIADRMHLAPVLRIKLMPLPFDLDHPFWVEEENIDLDYHIRRHTLPKPGRIADLETLIGRLHSNFLDRSRPLWEFYVIDGLEDGRVALYTKLHHCMLDGASSKALIVAMYDAVPTGRVIPPPPSPAPKGRKASANEILKGIAAHFVRQEIRAIQFVPEVLKAWARLALPDVQTLEFHGAPKPPPPAPKTLFNAAITSQRAYAMRTLPFGRMKRVAKQAQCKLNDVILAICSGALRRYLLEKDALPAETMNAMVPVAAAQPEGNVTANQNSMYVCSLATDIEDPYARLMAIHESSSEQKTLLGNIKNALLPDLSVIGSGTLMRGMVDLYCRAKIADRAPPVFNLVISNVALPQTPVYVAGAKIVSFNPCSIPFHGTALNITVQSYCDSVDFGLIACRRTVPDVSKVADYIEAEFPVLEAAVARAVAKPAAALPAARGAATKALPSARQPAAKRRTPAARTRKQARPPAAANLARTKSPPPRKSGAGRGAAAKKRAAAKNRTRNERSSADR